MASINRYRKKPVVIEAFQYKGNGNFEDAALPEWLWEAFESEILKPTNGRDPLRVTTLEGDVVVAPGDYIIRGVKGELYPCKADIFEATYELAE